MPAAPARRSAAVNNSRTATLNTTNRFRVSAEVYAFSRHVHVRRSSREG